MSWILLVTVFGFVALWLGWRWALHQCEAANVADWGNRWINRLDGLNRLFCRHFHRLGHQNIPLPARGGAVVVSNHVSGLDPLLLIAASPRPLRFLIAREEYDRWWLTWLFRAVGCIPVERAQNPRAAFAEAQRQLAAGKVVALFPHGGIHLDRDPPRPLKRGAALLAHATGVPIIAVRLDGVRGQGLTVSAVFLRSRVRLRHHAPLHPTDHEADQLLARLAQLLSPTHADEKT
jgi:1-acyl-sn-glycerol-3-phosphate acyltransferase